MGGHRSPVPASTPAGRSSAGLAGGRCCRAHRPAPRACTRRRPGWRSTGRQYQPAAKSPASRRRSAPAWGSRRHRLHQLLDGGRGECRGPVGHRVRVRPQLNREREQGGDAPLASNHPDSDGPVVAAACEFQLTRAALQLLQQQARDLRRALPRSIRAAGLDKRELELARGLHGGSVWVADLAMDRKLLGIYLQDHHAGSTSGWSSPRSFVQPGHCLRRFPLTPGRRDRRGPPHARGNHGRPGGGQGQGQGRPRG